jgi:hypothetical protein
MLAYILFIESETLLYAYNAKRFKELNFFFVFSS